MLRFLFIMQSNQATWSLVDHNGNTKASCLNSLEPLTLQQWQDRIALSVADAVDVGSYDLDVQFAELLKLKWHVVVKRVADVTPF